MSTMYNSRSIYKLLGFLICFSSCATNKMFPIGKYVDEEHTANPVIRPFYRIFIGPTFVWRQTIEFESDSTFTYTYDSDLPNWSNGKWKINNDTIYLISDDLPVKMLKVKSNRTLYELTWKEDLQFEYKYKRE